MTVQAPARVSPLGRVTPFRAHRLWERNYLQYRRVWTVIFSGLFEPIFYLFSIGVGLGALIGQVEGPGGALIDYDTFVAPALMAAAAMNGTITETTFNIFFKLRYEGIYEGILTTPMTPRDIAVGEVGWSLFRGLIYAIAFVLVMAVMGLTMSWWAVLAIPGAFLIGFAFGAVGVASTTYMRSVQDFDIVFMITMPIFLFSATFYPIDVYPAWLQQVAKFSPLYHGAELLRGLTVGVLDWSMVGHVAFLLIMGLVGLAIANRRFDALLRP